MLSKAHSVFLDEYFLDEYLLRSLKDFQLSCRPALCWSQRLSGW